MGKMSRDKGKRGERMWASLCREEGFDAHRTSQYCGNTGEASDVVGLPHIHCEVKFVERLNIFNYRYQDKKYVTIISCERTVKELMQIDEAVGSRIYERSKAYRVEIASDPTKNYRLTMG